MATELSLVKRFHQLAQDYDNRPVVVRRGTVKSILRFMQHDDWEVKHEAAATVLLLAQHPDNKEALCREKGFLPTLFESYKDSEIADPRLHEIYSEVFEELRAVLAVEEGQDALNAVDGTLSNRDDGSIRTVKNRPTRVAQGASSSRALTISVANLTPSTHDELENLLQTTRGVVSYTIDVPEKSVRIFLSTQTSALKLVLTDGGFDVDVVSEEAIERNEDAENAAAPRPTYKTGGLRGLNIFGDVDWKRTLVLHGIEGNSLQARLERQKEERARKHEQSKSTMSTLLGKLKSWW
jgi:hypothetical protein